MSFSRGFNAGFYGGAPISDLVPDLFPVSLNGRPYLLDDTKPFMQQTVRLLRQQADQSSSPSEASINPEDLWRRSMESWHHGAGQANFDRPDSDPFRFRGSKGLDVWTQWRLSLLHDTAQKLPSANTNLLLAVAGTRLYVLDGAAARYTSDLAVWTAVTGLPGPAPSGIASDGRNVYTVHAASGIYSTNTGTSAAASFNPRAANGICGYVKGRLMISNDQDLVNITGAATETVVLSHPNTSFRWVGVAEAKKHILAAGYSGDKSLIYKTAVKADGTALDVAAVAGELPDGEIVRSIQGYLGFLLIGTDLGVRFCAVDDGGDLTIGALIPTTAPVRCFEPQDRFVWYGLENYDGSSTGLGRVDLKSFTDTLTPAYASDLMVSGQGQVVSAATFLARRVMGVAGLGVYAEDPTKLVAAGTLDSGLIRYGLPEPKIAWALDVAHEPLVGGSHLAYLSADGGTFGLIGQHNTGGTEGRFPAGQKSAESFEIRVELDRDATNQGIGPGLVRQTLMAEPAPSRSELISVPLWLTENVIAGGVEIARNVQDDLDDIRRCIGLPEAVAFQAGDQAMAVLVKDYQFERHTRTTDGRAWEGSCEVLLKVPV